tara:strand:- start:349 stop:582 length:234 start_codon:yes stop_codon:yes gene_type:complete
MLVLQSCPLSGAVSYALNINAKISTTYANPKIANPYPLITTASEWSKKVPNIKPNSEAISAADIVIKPASIRLNIVM